MDSSLVRIFEISRQRLAPLFAGVIEEDLKNAWEVLGSGFVLRTDQYYRASCALASFNERSKGIAGITTPGICELLQFG